jgi:MtN3 and saliva related transmembrane protein
MPPLLLEAIGIMGALLTTVCWLPQAIRIVRARETRAISLPAYAAFAAGLLLWLIYGFALANAPLIGASAIELTLAGTIVALKLRHG